MAQQNVVDIEEAKAKRFLDRIASEPFVCFVVTQDHGVLRYVCDVDHEIIAKILEDQKSKGA